MHRLWISLLSIVASSSAFRLPASPPPKGSSIDSDWSTKNKKQPGFLRLISAWYAMVFLYFFWHHENYDLNTARPCLIAPTGRTCRDPDHRVTDFPSRRSGIKRGKRIFPFGLAPSLKTLLQKTVSRAGGDAQHVRPV